MSESFLLMKLSDNDNFVVGKMISETEGEVILESPIVTGKKIGRAHV